jgi:hypothetical protein
MIAWTGQSLSRHARLHYQLDAVVRFYEGGLEQLSDKWQGCGVSGEEYSSAKHLYSADLDVFGHGSLFELFCTARTGIGRAMLAGWLLRAAPPAEILARQEAVTELSTLLDLQEEWAMTGNADPTHVNSSGLWRLQIWATKSTGALSMCMSRKRMRTERCALITRCGPACLHGRTAPMSSRRWDFWMRTEASLASQASIKHTLPIEGWI